MTEAKPTPQKDAPANNLAGDRGIPSVNRVRSMQARVSSVLALSVVGLLGGGVLVYYYLGAWHHRSQVVSKAHAAVTQKAQGELVLPPLALPPPKPQAFAAAQPSAPSASSPFKDPGADSAVGSVAESVLGPAPPLPQSIEAQAPANLARRNRTPRPAGDGAVHAPRPDPALVRQLAGPALLSLNPDSREGGAVATSAGLSAAPNASNSLSGVQSFGASDHSSDAGGTLAGLLRASTIPTISAQRLPDQRLLLAKGTSIDCSLLTAIDTALPGFTTCIAAIDTYSADGSLVLLERGTKLFGETRSGPSATSTRVFVLWTEARSPSGVVARLDSPATDALGRSGLTGDIDRHFWERFGSGLLVSVVDGVVNYVSQPRGAGLVLNTAPANAPMTEALRGSANTPPTISVPPGAHIQVLVARDVNFASVYGASSDDPR